MAENYDPIDEDKEVGYAGCGCGQPDDGCADAPVEQDYDPLLDVEIAAIEPEWC
jgi:hypothetical protein